MRKLKDCKKGNNQKIPGGGVKLFGQYSKILLGIVTASAILTGCAKQAAMPFSSIEYSSMSYIDAKEQLEKAGFSNITIKEDSTVNEDQKEKVKSITVDGKGFWSNGEQKKVEAPIELTYYVLKEYEVTMGIETKAGDGVPEFIVSTNLPDDTKLVFSLLSEDGNYTEQQKQTVKDGTASAIFKDRERQLAAGKYSLTVVMDPDDQPRKIRKELGAKGDCLVGDCVRTDPDGKKYTFLETEYESFFVQSAQSQMKSYAEVVQDIDAALTVGFGNEYTMSEDSAGITVNAWKDGVAMCAALAKNEDSDALKQWDSLKESTIKMQDSLQSLLTNSGYSDKIIVINILNDVKKDNTLLTVSYGIVAYDAVSEINLLGN